MCEVIAANPRCRTLWSSICGCRSTSNLPVRARWLKRWHTTRGTFSRGMIRTMHRLFRPLGSWHSRRPHHAGLTRFVPLLLIRSSIREAFGFQRAAYTRTRRGGLQIATSSWKRNSSRHILAMCCGRCVAPAAHSSHCGSRCPVSLREL